MNTQTSPATNNINVSINDAIGVLKDIHRALDNIYQLLVGTQEATPHPILTEQEFKPLQTQALEMTQSLHKALQTIQTISISLGA